ncbi:MAG: hypothetical protein ABL884_07840 [Methyloglobulus sp.]
MQNQHTSLKPRMTQTHPTVPPRRAARRPQSPTAHRATACGEANKHGGLPSSQTRKTQNNRRTTTPNAKLRGVLPVDGDKK